jgi:GT2 family glycosyltransferase
MSADCNLRLGLRAMGPDIGVVVIGRNEGPRLIRCLRSVQALTDAIVYVDSGSTDGSVSAAASLGVSVVELDMSIGFTAARARNEGFAALRRKPEVAFVQFIDGDCELVQDWLPGALGFIAGQPDVAAVCGRRRERHPDASIYNALCDIEWDTPAGEAIACGGDSLVRVEAFAAIGGFRPDLVAGEEPEMCLRLRKRGWRIWRLPAEMTLHDAAMTRFRQWWLRSVRGGFAFAAVWWLHRKSSLHIWKRETSRAVIWGGILPSFLLLGSILNPWILVALLLYPAQICRIALSRPPKDRPWAYASFIVLGKFAEFQGVMKFVSRRWRGGSSSLIEYKTPVASAP